ncbi:unnamed protein product [Linum tenue]|uniref:Uncharacterized protein n=1 Tax=Linum tenue TaxID=586396 RepID=A0AAV0HAI0_9ROSI|nr:unnamed protein product [Linum tenue]
MNWTGCRAVLLYPLL